MIEPKTFKIWIGNVEDEVDVRVMESGKSAWVRAVEPHWLDVPIIT